jgi:hypothetical protein
VNHHRETTYWRLLDLFGDQDWHSFVEINAITAYPTAWIAELRASGHTIEEDGDLYRVCKGG